MWAAETTSIKQIYPWTMDALWFPDSNPIPVWHQQGCTADFCICWDLWLQTLFKHKGPVAKRFHFDIDGLKLKEKNLPLNSSQSSVCDFHCSCHSLFFFFVCWLQSNLFHLLLLKLVVPAVMGKAFDNRLVPEWILHLHWAVNTSERL